MNERLILVEGSDDEPVPQVAWVRSREQTRGHSRERRRAEQSRGVSERRASRPPLGDREIIEGLTIGVDLEDYLD